MFIYLFSIFKSVINNIKRALELLEWILDSGDEVRLGLTRDIVKNLIKNKSNVNMVKQFNYN